MEEIFRILAVHFIKGMMVHDQMASYYDFLGLRGYKRMHEYQFYKDSKAYREIQRYYINVYGKFVPEERVEDPQLIPEGWKNYKREDVDVNTKRNAVEGGFKKWISWETDTKIKLQDCVKRLYNEGYVADAVFVNKMLKDVSHELKYAERKFVDLISTNYDMSYIVESQKDLHDHYKDKLKYIHKS